MLKTPSPPLAEQAAAEITDMILTERRFLPGDKLPNELELSQELGISRVTLREAIRILCTRGLLEIRRGRGTFVLSDDPSLRAASGMPTLDLSGTGLRELLELSMAVKPMAAYYAAIRAGEEELRQIGALCLKMEELSSQDRPFPREERAFQDAIAEACRNRLFRSLLALVNSALYTSDAPFRGNAGETLRDYRELARCLQSRDPDAAREAMRAAILHDCQRAGIELESSTPRF